MPTVRVSYCHRPDLSRFKKSSPKKKKSSYTTAHQFRTLHQSRQNKKKKKSLFHTLTHTHVCGRRDGKGSVTDHTNGGGGKEGVYWNFFLFFEEGSVMASVVSPLPTLLPPLHRWSFGSLLFFFLFFLSYVCGGGMASDEASTDFSGTNTSARNTNRESDREETFFFC